MCGATSVNITVLGAGAWGTALAISLSAHHRVTLWTRNAEQLAAMKSQRSNARYLPGHLLPENLLLEPNLSSALDAAELVILAVPVAGLRETLRQVAASSRGGNLARKFHARRVVRPQFCAGSRAR